MKFVCLVYIDSKAMTSLSPEDDRRLTDATIEEDWSLRDRGRLVLAQPLQPPEATTVLRMQAGKLARTDGPYMETKEFLGGFFVIEAGDMDEAVAIAGDTAMAPYCITEIRPALEQVHSVTGRGRPPAAEG
ncbi:hypothetical protein VE25_02675 [Devosia geojensis]|uniref:YCII-related domain-containing protein n=1 Tax=Devosia geojensis TaxID=443610 RepID=A0A0F5FYV2_9HYPH|nr:YciI family protein [Devosia geojensis]KKB13377.1 hypothetical protein VE25_02675 [Devosia geojensis]